MLRSRLTRNGFILTGVVAVILICAGCMHAGSVNTESTTDGVLAEPENAPQYLDFGDILIPTELKIDKRSSFVFRTSGQSAGVLSLKGRVEIDSLISFFENNMAKDNWRLVSSFKSLRSLMLFQKETRWCVINISAGDFFTYAEVWVSPTVPADSGTDLLK